MSTVKRTAFDDRRDVATANAYHSEHLPCRKCQALTAREDLMNFGGMCHRCHEAWRAEINPRWMPNRELTDNERSQLRLRVRNGLRKLAGQQVDPKAWARALKAREEAGERLDPALRSAWRDALSHFDDKTEESAA